MPGAVAQSMVSLSTPATMEGVVELIHRLGSAADVRIAAVERRADATEERIGRQIEKMSDRVIEALRDLGSLKSVAGDVEDLRRQFITLVDTIEDARKEDRSEHKTMSDRIEAVEQAMRDVQVARKARGEVLQHGIAFLTWTWEHGWKVLLGGYFVWTSAVGPMLKTALPVTHQQPMLSQGSPPVDIRERFP